MDNASLNIWELYHQLYYLTSFFHLYLPFIMWYM